MKLARGLRRTGGAVHFQIHAEDIPALGFKTLRDITTVHNSTKLSHDYIFRSHVLPCADMFEILLVSISMFKH